MVMSKSKLGLMMFLIQTPYSSWMICTSIPIFLSWAAMTWAPATIVGNVGITLSVVLKPFGKPGVGQQLLGPLEVRRVPLLERVDRQRPRLHGRRGSGPVTEPRPDAATCSTSFRSMASAERLAHPDVGVRLPPVVDDQHVEAEPRGARSAVSRLSSLTSR